MSIAADSPEDVLRKCIEALHGPAYIGQDEARDIALAALASLTTRLEQAEGLVERLADWLDNYHTEAPPEFETDVDAARALSTGEPTKDESALCRKPRCALAPLGAHRHPNEGGEPTKDERRPGLGPGVDDSGRLAMP